MVKKVLTIILIVGFTGVLVWGGMNRTLAKQEDGSARQGHETDVSGSVSTSQGDAQGKGLSNDRSQGSGNGQGGGNGNGVGGGQGRENRALSAAAVEALHLALADEVHALGFYQSVLADFGEVEPFVEIAQAEQRHIESLLNQFHKYGIPVPEIKGPGDIPSFESLNAACQAGVDAELANINLYDELFSMTDDPDLVQVFTNLRRASQESHLPAFLDCQ